MAVRNDGVTTARWGTTLANLADITAYGSSIVGFAVGTLTNTPLILGTNGLNRINIVGGGSVGIGTSSPTELLHVAGTIRIDSTSTAPQTQGGTIDSLLTNTDNLITAMGVPDNYLRVSIDGNIYAIPAYSPSE
jgi:hypothetical protein